MSPFLLHKLDSSAGPQKVRAHDWPFTSLAQLILGMYSSIFHPSHPSFPLLILHSHPPLPPDRPSRPSVKAVQKCSYRTVGGCSPLVRAMRGADEGSDQMERMI